MSNIAELVAHFRMHLQNLNKSEHTIKQYTIDCKQFAAFAEDYDSSFEQQPTQVIEAYCSTLAKTYKSTASINRKIASMRNFIQFLQMRGMTLEIEESLLQPVQMDAKALSLLTNIQLRQAVQLWLRVFEEAQDSELHWIALRNYAIIQTIHTLGLKPAEVVRMKWTHIDGDTIRIQSGRKNRRVPLTLDLIQLLEQYQKETRSFLPVAAEVDSIWLGVGNTQGQPITVKTVERIFQHISMQLGFKVTATNVRYKVIERETIVAPEDLAGDLYKQFGYARKGVMQERQDRMQPKER